jgi:hypothetical protein
VAAGVVDRRDQPRDRLQPHLEGVVRGRVGGAVGRAVVDDVGEVARERRQRRRIAFFLIAAQGEAFAARFGGAFDPAAATAGAAQSRALPASIARTRRIEPMLRTAPAARTTPPTG